MTRGELFHLFGEFGAIRKVDILFTPQRGVNIALIIYDDLVYPCIESLKGLLLLQSDDLQLMGIFLPNRKSNQPEKMKTLESATIAYRQEVPFLNEAMYYSLRSRYGELPFMDLVAFARVSDEHKRFAFDILNRRYNGRMIQCEDMTRGRQITYYELYMVMHTFGVKIRIENLPPDCALFLEDIRVIEIACERLRSVYSNLNAIEEKQPDVAPMNCFRNEPSDHIPIRGRVSRPRNGTIARGCETRRPRANNNWRAVITAPLKRKRGAFV